MISQAGLFVIQRLADRPKSPQRSPHETAQFVGVNNGVAVFRTANGDKISMPLKNVVTNQSLTGVFSISRPKYGYPYAFKEV